MQDLLALVEPWNGRSLLTLKKKVITVDTSLNQDMNIDPEDAAELLTEVLDAFGMQPDEVDFSCYYPRDWRNAQPLTVNMLILSARAGRWLYA